MSDLQPPHDSGMKPGRLESLSDAIFAFSMTLLILSINLPEAGKYDDVLEFLRFQSPEFRNFFLSFLLLAFFWIVFSQQFNHIRHTDGLLLVITVLTLLFVIMVPLSTTLMNDYSNDRVAETFFSGNLLLLTSLMMLNWIYAARREYLTDSDRLHIRRVGRQMTVLPLVPLVALLLALVAPGWSTLVYLAIPVMLMVSSIRGEATHPA